MMGEDEATEALGKGVQLGSRLWLGLCEGMCLEERRREGTSNGTEKVSYSPGGFSTNSLGSKLGMIISFISTIFVAPIFFTEKARLIEIQNERWPGMWKEGLSHFIGRKRGCSRNRPPWSLELVWALAILFFLGIAMLGTSSRCLGFGHLVGPVHFGIKLL